MQFLRDTCPGCGGAMVRIVIHLPGIAKEIDRNDPYGRRVPQVMYQNSRSMFMWIDTHDCLIAGRAPETWIPA